MREWRQLLSINLSLILLLSLCAPMAAALEPTLEGNPLLEEAVQPQEGEALQPDGGPVPEIPETADPAPVEPVLPEEMPEEDWTPEAKTLPETRVEATLILDGNRSELTAESRQCFIEDTIDLAPETERLERQMRQSISDATLTAWTTGRDGSGKSYGSRDKVILTGDLTLYAQWEFAEISIDGTSYPMECHNSGNGWRYNAFSHQLDLDHYQGGSILFSNRFAFKLRVHGDCVINGNLDLGNYTEIILEWNDNLTVNCGSGTAVHGTNCQVYMNDGSNLIVNGSLDASAVQLNHVWLNGNGDVAIHSPYTLGADIFQLNVWDSVRIEITAAEKALFTRKLNVDNYYGKGIFLSPDSKQAAPAYDGGPYLRVDKILCPVTLHANGGRWTDYGAEERTWYVGPYEGINLGDYKGFLINPGKILTGWCDATDSREYGVDDWVVSAANLTLYAKWEQETLRINGRDYPLNRQASGSGWSFTPKSGSMAARLMLSNYQGGPIYTTGDLMIRSNGNVRVSGEMGIPAIKTLGSLRIEIESGSMQLSGGLGENAIRAGEGLEIVNWSKLELRGGEGGEAIYAGNDSTIENAGKITAVGGSLSAGASVWGDLVMRGGGESIFLSGGAYYCAVSCGNLVLDESLKLYAGENASDAHRVYDLWECYPYAHFVARTVQVKLMANGGSIGGESSASNEYAFPESGSITLQSAEEPIRPGYQFAGWNTKADGSGKSYAMGQEYWPEKEGDTLTLFAQWTDTDFTRDFSNGQMHLTLTTGLKKSTKVIYAVYNDQDKLLRVAFGTPEDITGEICYKWSFPVSAKPQGKERFFFLTEKNTPARGEIRIP